MKNFTLVCMFLLTSCVSSQQPMEWRYTPFTDNSDVSLEQAKVICAGTANNAAILSPQYSAPSEVRCNTIGNINHNYYNSNTQCGQYTNPWANIATSMGNNARAQSAYENTYKSCLAQHGWRAFKVRKYHGSSGGNKQIKGTQAALDACIEGSGNEIVSCQIRNEIVKKGFCDCKTNSGVPLK